MKSRITESHYLTYHAFLNSLLTESKERIDAVVEHADKIIISLTASSEIHLELAHYSPFGRHRFNGTFTLQEPGLPPQPIAFFELVERILDRYFFDIEPGKKQRFLARVKQSDQYINLASQQAKPPFSINALLHSEQGLLGGHSMHPCPKSCEPLDEKDQHAFLPDHHQTFSLSWYKIKKDKLAGDDVRGSLIPALQALFASQFSMQHLAEIEDDWVPIPMHPLQANYWDNSKDAASLEGDVLALDLHHNGWCATSSTRAIFHPQSAWILKMSLPVKLTNSLRLLSENEAQRGIQLSHLLKSPAGIELKQRLSQMHIIEEPMWCGIRANNGLVLPISITCFRDNPFAREPHFPSHLLATANQLQYEDEQYTTQIAIWIREHAQKEAIALNQAAKIWFSHFLNNVFLPLCIARNDYGLILLAHQQNLLLSIENGLPVAAALKDCQGIGLTDLALKRFDDVFTNDAPCLFMPTDEVNPYLAYYLVGNTLATTIANIAAECDISENALWLMTQEQLYVQQSQNPIDKSFLNYLLTSPQLKWKRNFFCAISDLNENTLADPAPIYCQIDNPLYAIAPKHVVRKALPDGRIVLIKSCPLHPENKECQFSLHYQGECLANFCAHLYAPKHVYLEAFEATTDHTLWWIAIEHALFGLQAEHIKLLQAPHSLTKAYCPIGEMSKQHVLMRCPTWHTASEPAKQKLEAQTAENGITHPARPQKPIGTFYQRYFYGLKRTLTLRVADVERDLSCFHQWHNHPHNAAIWELSGSREMHREYLLKQTDDPHQIPVMLEFDGVPFGYIELYWTPEDRLGPQYDCAAFDRGLHILVGNPRFKGFGYFKTWAAAVMQYCFIAHPETERVMGEPNAANKKVISLAALVGMEAQFEFDFPHKRAMLLQCERSAFFSQFAL